MPPPVVPPVVPPAEVPPPLVPLEEPVDELEPPEDAEAELDGAAPLEEDVLVVPVVVDVDVVLVLLAG